jgi:hypothetical protein
MAGDTIKSGGPAARYLFLFLLGLVVGVVATIMVLRAIDARRDKFHGSLMHVQQWHLGQLRGDLESNRCTPNDALPHLQALRLMANDLEAAFPDLADDQRFAGHARDMRARLDAAIAAPPVGCEAAGSTLAAIGEGCNACHQDFR